MTKKLLLTLVSVAFLVFMLTGCGDKKETEKENETEQKSENTDNDNTEKPEECLENYHPNNETGCEPDSRIVPCADLPEHARWCNNKTSASENDFGKLGETYQVWNGNDWQPSNTGIAAEYYDKTDGYCKADFPESEYAGCVFVCDDNYYWNGSECFNGCDPNPCTEARNSTGECFEITEHFHSCGCKEGYLWNSGKFECSNPCEGNPCGDIEFSTGECKVKNAVTYICGCEPDHEFFEGKCEQSPVKDPISSLMWSPLSPELEDWSNGAEYCENLEFGGYTDWRLPNLDELRTLVSESKCPKIALNGKCKASEKDDCLSKSCRTEETCGNSGTDCGRFIEDGRLLSSSHLTEYPEKSWYVNFDWGEVDYSWPDDLDYSGKVRCVR